MLNLSKLIFPTSILLISIYIYSCANQGNITGGTKDTIPPSLIHSFPTNKSLSISSKTFSFEFDERVSADQLMSKMVITPYTENKFKSLVKKNKLLITFEDEFEDSTTYTFNFADGVVDITEKNPVENFKLAFSTGPVIDSIYINGRINNLYDDKVQKNILIALYDINDTLDLFTGKPKYFTHTLEDGTYLIENIKDGKYRYYTYVDENNNLQNEPQTEAHGFISDTLDLTTSKDSVNIKIQLIDATRPAFIRAKNTGLYYDVLYNKYCKSYTLENIDSNPKLKIPESSLIKENQTLRFYKHESFDYQTDSLQLKINFTDSLNNSITDTVFVKFLETKRKPDEFNQTANLTNNRNIPNQIAFKLSFTKPIISTTYDSIKLSYDVFQNITLHDSLFTWNYNKTELTYKTTIDKTLIPLENDRLKIAKAIADSLQALIPDSLKTTKVDSLVNKSTDEVNHKNLNSEKSPKSISKGKSIGKSKGNNKGKNVKKKTKAKRGKYTLYDNQINLTIPAATFISVDNDSSKVIDKKFIFEEENEFGVLRGKVITESKSYILQLTSPDYEDIIAEKKNPRDFEFKSIPAGKYTFRVLIDNNGDGKWSPGNILKNIEPEKIHFHNEITVLRANWEVEKIEITF